MYKILVNTTDRFEDCWEPFFTLFEKYFIGYEDSIFLNTETKSYAYKNLKIVPVKNNYHSPNTKISWSECLIRALKKIDAEIVLYLQEDYFLNGLVDVEAIDEYVGLMEENTDIHCVHLTNQAVTKTQSTNEYPNLLSVVKDNHFSVSCQAALWRKEVLLENLRSYESAWNFEWWGSRRAEIMDYNFYVADLKNERFKSEGIIPYIFTGVIGGEWNKGVVALFKENDVTVDYSKRGFYTPRKINLKERIQRKLKRLPVEIRSYIHLLKIKFFIS